MNVLVNKLLLAEDKFIPEIQLKQPGFIYSGCGPFTKDKERINKFKETVESRYIYQNEIDKACFQHDIDYGDFKDLNRRTAADKLLSDKAFNIAKNSKYDGYQRGLASAVYSKDLNTDFALGNCFFGVVKQTKNADPDKYKYSGYGIGFHSLSRFSWTDRSEEKSVTIFGVDNSSSVHIDSKNKTILVVGEGPTQCLDNTAIRAEARYSINFTESGKLFVLSLHYN